ncbi:hypothetical protein QYF61_025419 [Mycteria americana]|uniref:Uncharacterized protein n=1 Tax=Mycteria americana TaxID=33587 RepID=A0AAN7NTM4_MYCAM|nr:hypothetical protein QYF61_025419 [Mycteria americana]
MPFLNIVPSLAFNELFQEMIHHILHHALKAGRLWRQGGYCKDVVRQLGENKGNLTKQTLTYLEQEQRVAIKMLDGLEHKMYKKQPRDQCLLKALGDVMTPRDKLDCSSINVRVGSRGKHIDSKITQGHIVEEYEDSTVHICIDISTLSRNNPNAVIAKLGATFPGKTVCCGPAETLGKAGSVGSPLCKWAGTGSMQKHLCAQWFSSVESTDKINLQESEGEMRGVVLGCPGARCTSCVSLTGVLEKVQNSGILMQTSEGRNSHVI